MNKYLFILHLTLVFLKTVYVTNMWWNENSRKQKRRQRERESENKYISFLAANHVRNAIDENIEIVVNGVRMQTFKMKQTCQQCMKLISFGSMNFVYKIPIR